MTYRIVLVAAVLFVGVSGYARAGGHVSVESKQSATSQVATAPAGPVSLAVLQAEVPVVELEAGDRDSVAATIDALIAESIAGNKNVLQVDRQALDKVLAERASIAGGASAVSASELTASLRPFWSAGVLICPVLRPIRSWYDRDRSKITEMSLEIDAVIAQSGQLVGETQLVIRWKGHDWEKPPQLAQPLAALLSSLPQKLQHARQTKYIEIAEPRLVSPLKRLLWLRDDLGDTLRASLNAPGVEILRPRHPTSTKEERLLRIMGLSSPVGQERQAGFACSPDMRLDVELHEQVGKELGYDKTPITIELTLNANNGAVTRKTLSGMASQYSSLSETAALWLNKQLAKVQPSGDQSQDQQRAQHLAQRELELARQMMKECWWYELGGFDPSPKEVPRMRVLAHALRASHLDPTNEEAARLTVIGIDSPYAFRGDGRSTVCTERVIAEGQRYLDRFGSSPFATQVRQHMGNRASQQLTEIRQRSGDWIGQPLDPNICRYAKISLLHMEWALQRRIIANFWSYANNIGQCVLGHCPPDQLENERAYWRSYWKKTVEPLGSEAPRWEYIDLYYYIRKKDHAGLRESLTGLAKIYPRSDQHVWWGTRPYRIDGPDYGKPGWKVRTQWYLKKCGDPQWQTWVPQFSGADTFTWDPHQYNTFLREFNPPMPQAWDTRKPVTLETTSVSLITDLPAATSGRPLVRPLLSAGGWMWMCTPAPGEDMTTRRNLLVAPLSSLEAGGEAITVKTQSISWPAHPDEGKRGATGPAARCWLTTTEDNVPTVWIGTAWHGVARFDLVDGKWRGRWYTARDGLPGEDILLIRPCLHDGKKRLLVLSQPRQPQPEVFLKSLWSLDPATGKVTSIASSTRWQTYWHTLTKAPQYVRSFAVWKDGTQVPLCLYNRDDFPNLDAGQIVDIVVDPLQHGEYVLAHDKSGARVWTTVGGGLTQLEGGKPTTRLLDGASIPRSVYYESPAAKKGFKCGWSIGGLQRWNARIVPDLDARFCSDEPCMVWGYSCGLLTAYCPAGQSGTAGDAWYGPWMVRGSSTVVDYIDGYVWVSCYGPSLARFKPSEAIAQAQAGDAIHSTLQWKMQYSQRAGEKWFNSLRISTAQEEYDKALAIIASARDAKDALNPPAGKWQLDMWEALVRVQKGDLDGADRLFLKVADDTLAEPLARGLALINLVSVRYQAKDWQGLGKALDKLEKLFPSLNTRQQFNSCGDAIEWFRKEILRNTPQTSPGQSGGSLRMNATTRATLTGHEPVL